MWRIIKYVLVLYVGVNLIGAFLFWPRIQQFLFYMPRVAPADFTKPVSKLDAQQQDMSHLETILNYDRSFSDDAKDRFQQSITDLKSQNIEMTEAAFYLELRALIAIADNAHTTVEASPVFQDFNRSGVDIYRFSDGYFIVRAHKDHQNLLGQRVTYIGERTVENVIEALRAYTGGPDNWRDQQALNILRSPELLHAAGLVSHSDKLALTVVSETGETAVVELTAKPAAGNSDYFRHAFMTLLPEALNDEGENWVRTLYASSQPIADYLTLPSEIVLTKEIEAGLYVRSNYLLGSKEIPLKKKLVSALESAPEEGFSNIIVDLRWNPGGDYGNAIPFTKLLPSALKDNGKVYVITGSDTFSAAIVFAALIKQAAPDQTMIIGETMGDRPQFWAERGKPFFLPNSGYWIGYSTGYHDWERGCAKTHKFCFPPNEKLEQDIGEFSLDVEVAPTFADYAAGKDIVMDWILENAAF